MDKYALIEKINSIEGLTDEERTALTELLREHKKYGLVWEDKPEDVEERLRDNLPILHEVPDKAILSDSPDAPNHILIEGDNLEALTALTYTHSGRIDVIYIDPPYNTGNKDFIYNDRYIDKDDAYRHSTWLSFMEKRLKIAKQLLSDRGVIFISIDDNEQAQLKLLCDEVFGENNFIAQCVRKRRDSQANLSRNISPIHEYVFIYSMCKGDVLNKIPATINEKEYKNPDHDCRGSYTTMPCTNKGGTVYSVTTPNGNVITEEWRFKKETYEELVKDNRIVFPKGGKGKPRYKLFLKDKKAEGVLANTWLENISSNQQGTIELKKVMGEVSFNNPKPMGLISFCAQLAGNKFSIILDFFAGSGTTLHATMQLNKDGGHRQCILVTNNENNICEEVTYVRNKRVIEGYTTPKGERVEGLTANNLRYYKTELLPREQTVRNKHWLMDAATDLLCIKNNLYSETDEFGGKPLNKKAARCFAEGKRMMLVIYNEITVDAFAETIRDMNVEERIMIYVFSLTRYPQTDNFCEVLDKVELCALPAAIYDAYRHVLPDREKRQREMNETITNEGGLKND